MLYYSFLPTQHRLYHFALLYGLARGIALDTDIFAQCSRIRQIPAECLFHVGIAQRRGIQW